MCHKIVVTVAVQVGEEGGDAPVHYHLIQHYLHA